jgi:putative salt-induced outer membrane protein
LIASVSCLAPLMAICDPAPAPPPQDVWTGTGQAGYVSTSGNTQSKAANAAIDMGYLDGPWDHMFHLGGLYGQSTGVLSAERWDALWQSNYDLTTDLFTFGSLRYAHDMFSGFDYQATGAVGIGYKFFNTDATKLSVQVGVGYEELRPELITKNDAGAVTDRSLQPSESSAVGTLGVLFSQALSSTTAVSDNLLVNYASIDTLITNKLALTVKMSNKLALSVGYAIQDNTNPPVGLKKLDTLETLNLVYAF